MSDNVVTTEQFIINDIEMGIAPSDIQLFDDNYIFEQSFLRSNSVYCYRSKYSDTKMVLNFPFQIGPYVDGSEDSNHTENCLKLITELNQAAIAVDAAKIEQLIATIPHSEEHIALAIREMIRNYDFDTIIDLTTP